MSAVASSACLRFGADGVPEVETIVHLSGRSYVRCHTYPGHAPILAVTDAHVHVSVTVPDTDRVTGQDLVTARQLAAAVADYVAELERIAAAASGSGPGRDDAAGRAA